MSPISHQVASAIVIPNPLSSSTHLIQTFVFSGTRKTTSTSETKTIGVKAIPIKPPTILCHTFIRASPSNENQGIILGKISWDHLHGPLWTTRTPLALEISGRKHQYIFPLPAPKFLASGSCFPVAVLFLEGKSSSEPSRPWSDPQYRSRPGGESGKR